MNRRWLRGVAVGLVVVVAAAAVLLGAAWALVHVRDDVELVEVREL